MKKIFSSVLCAFFLFYSSISLSGEIRLFVGSNGKEIKAEFLQYDKEKDVVHIRLEGGKESKVKLSLFSEKSRQDILNNFEDGTDNPFGESDSKPTRKKIEGPASKKIEDIVKTAKEAVAEMERTNSPMPVTGNLPTLYAELGIIQALAGRKEDAKNSFIRFQKENNRLTNPNDKGYNYYKTEQGIIDAGFIDLVDAAKDDLKGTQFPFAYLQILALEYGKRGDHKKAEKYFAETTKNMSIYLDYLVEIDKESEAILQASKLDAKYRPYALRELGKKLLSKNKIDESSELFSSAEAIEDTDKCRIAITQIWIDAGKPDKARHFIDRFQNKKQRAALQRNLTAWYISKNDFVQAKKLLTSAILVFDDDRQKTDAAMLFSIMGEHDISKSIRESLINEIEKDQDRFTKEMRLLSVRSQFFFLDGQGDFSQICKNLLRVMSDASAMSKHHWTSWMKAREYSIFFGEDKTTNDFCDRIRKQIPSIDDPKKRANAFKSLENQSPTDWFEYMGWFSAKEAISLLVATDQTDKAVEMIQRVHHPFAKVRFLRILAKEEYGNNSKK